MSNLLHSFPYYSVFLSSLLFARKDKRKDRWLRVKIGSPFPKESYSKGCATILRLCALRMIRMRSDAILEIRKDFPDLTRQDAILSLALNIQLLHVSLGLHCYSALFVLTEKQRDNIFYRRRAVYYIRIMLLCNRR